MSRTQRSARPSEEPALVTEGVPVFATSFDAVDGNYRSMDLRGRGRRHINDGWAAGPNSYLGPHPFGGEMSR